MGAQRPPVPYSGTDGSKTLRWREVDSNWVPTRGDIVSWTVNRPSHHLPLKLGLRFALKASTPSRKSSELRSRP